MIMPAMELTREGSAMFQLIFCIVKLLVNTIKKETIEIVVSEVAIID
jgi:hypothetical protein